jgi:hypothetical protein
MASRRWELWIIGLISRKGVESMDDVAIVQLERVQRHGFPVIFMNIAVMS